MKRGILTNILFLLLFSAIVLAYPKPGNAAQGPAAGLEEVSVFENVYINDIYGFALPLPAIYKACYVPPYGAGGVVTIIPQKQHCSTRELSPSIVISAFYGKKSPDSQTDLTKVYCDTGHSVETDLRFGTAPLFRCSDESKRLITFFAAKATSESGDGSSYDYIITIHKTEDGSEPSNKNIERIFSAVRFLRR
jgi:hypothetical protein